MRILYVDVDTLRPDHLGCYGYHRDTSPNLDRVAREGVRFTNCYVPDAPCLPSRASLFSGRFGIHTGAINHGGTQADPFVEGEGRLFRSEWSRTCWMACLRQAGFRTITVSPFGERHSAWHFYAGFNEMYNPGKGGLERADEVVPIALDWLERNGRSDNWFLHVHVWDPHTPYRTPESFGNPFEDDPLPAWLTEEVRQRHWQGCGPHSAREIIGWGEVSPAAAARYPRQPQVADSLAAVRAMFDGYDCGIRYADEHLGRLLDTLADQGVLDDTVVMISSDHGEALGELNVYGDHQTADHVTTRVPLIVRWPGLGSANQGRVDAVLHYQEDWAATLVELVGGKVPESWDGSSFAGAFRSGDEEGRDYLVVSQGAWSCQRGIRFDDYHCVRSYHDGYHGFPDVMLFDVAADPHEQRDLAPERPEVVARAMLRLDEWYGQMMRAATHPVDPMWVVLREGGALHTRGQLPAYLRRLRETGRGEWADRLAAMHPSEA